MAEDELRVVSPDPRKDMDAVVELIARVFSHRGYYDRRDQCRNGYIGHSHYDWRASQVGWIGDEMVTHWGVWDFQMRVGAAKLRVAGIGAVATSGDFRRRGLMARTVLAGVPVMRQCGYDLSLLYGIDNFYHKFGYVRAWPQDLWVLALGDLLACESAPPKTEKLTVGHLPEMAKVYNAAARHLSGTARRPTYSTMQYPSNYEGLVWRKGRGGAIQGWVAFRGNEVLDAVGQPDEILAVLRGEAIRRYWPDARFSDLHWDSELCRVLRRGTVRLESSYRRSGGAMVLTIDLASSLSKLEGEMTRRLKASPLAKWRGDLLIADRRQRVGLRIAGGKCRVGEPAKTKHAVRGGDYLAQLLIGADDPMETVREGGLKLSGDASALVPVLFPARHPKLAGLDRF